MYTDLIIDLTKPPLKVDHGLIIHPKFLYECITYPCNNRNDNLVDLCQWNDSMISPYTVYPHKYAHGFCFAVLCCGYTLTDFLISIRLTSLALWQSNDCPSASKATLMNIDKYVMWMSFIMNDCIITTKQSTTKPCAYFLGIWCILAYNGHIINIDGVGCVFFPKIFMKAVIMPSFENDTF